MSCALIGKCDSLTLSFPTQVGSTFKTSFLHFLLSLTSVRSWFFSLISSVTQSDQRLFDLPLALAPSSLVFFLPSHHMPKPQLRYMRSYHHMPLPQLRYMRSYHHMPIPLQSLLSLIFLRFPPRTIIMKLIGIIYL